MPHLTKSATIKLTPKQRNALTDLFQLVSTSPRDELPPAIMAQVWHSHIDCYFLPPELAEAVADIVQHHLAHHDQPTEE